MPGVCFLDLSTKTGVAFPGDAPGLPRTILWTLPKARGSQEAGYEYGDLFSTFRRNLVDLLTTVQPTTVGFEAPIGVMGGGSPVRRSTTNQMVIEILYGLATLAQEATKAVMGYEAWALNIQDLKRHMTGDARADKLAVIKAVKLLGVDVGDPPDDNRADAAAGWFCLSSLTDRKFRPGRDTPLFGARA